MKLNLWRKKIRLSFFPISASYKKWKIWFYTFTAEGRCLKDWVRINYRAQVHRTQQCARLIKEFLIVSGHQLSWHEVNDRKSPVTVTQVLPLKKAVPGDEDLYEASVSPLTTQIRVISSVETFSRWLTVVRLSVRSISQFRQSRTDETLLHHRDDSFSCSLSNNHLFHYRLNCISAKLWILLHFHYLYTMLQQHLKAVLGDFDWGFHVLLAAI